MRPWRAPGGLHLLLAVLVPGAFSTLAVYWLTGLTPLRPAAGAALVFSIVMAVWAPWRLRTHQGPLRRLWVWVVLNLLYYAANAAVTPGPWPWVFMPEGPTLFWWGAGFLQGMLTAFWATQLAPRARLFQLLEGIPEGKELEDRVRDFQVDADFSRLNRASLEAFLAVSGGLSAALASGTAQGGPASNLVLLGGYLALCLLVGVLLRAYRREMEALMYGHRLTWGDKLAPLAWSAGLLVAAGAAAAGLVALGGPWFDWSTLQGGGRGPVELPPAAEASPPPDPGALGQGDYRLTLLFTLLALLLHFEHIAFVVRTAGQLVWAAAPWAAAAFLVWPLVRWLLGGGRETKGLLRRWRRLLVLQFRAFLAGWAAWWTGPVGPAAVSLGRESPRDWVLGLFRAPGAGRRSPYPEVVRGFLRVVRWAEPVTAYRAGETTREFLDRLAGLLPDRAGPLQRLRDLLDQELFGAEGLAPADRAEFRRLVEAATSTPPGPPPAGGVSS